MSAVAFRSPRGIARLPSKGSTPLSGGPRFLAALGMTTLVACEGATVRFSGRASDASAIAADVADRERARQDSIVRSSPGYVIDSLRPIEDEIRLFQQQLGEPSDGFSFGATSHAALVTSFVRAIEQNDTTALARLVVNRKEFGYLVYPSSENVRPPYRQAPELVWLQRAAATNKGASRLLSRFGGRPLGYAGFSCLSPAVTQGDNAVWRTCSVRLTASSGDTSSLRMFGPIIERGGRFKFLSLANGL
jgi:hypothetical protein